MARASIKKSTVARAKKDGASLRRAVGPGGAADSFQNFALNLGLGTNNALSQSAYGFNPITRVRTLLEWIHRGSWVGGVAVDLLADDMTRGGVEILSTNTPKDAEKLQQGMTRLKIWSGLRDNVAWSSLYGGSIAVLLIDGQNPETPLRIETVGRNQFKGLMVLDRWMVDPDLSRLVGDYGPHLGLPTYYRVTADAPAMRGHKIHYTRCIRLEGVRLPYWQRVMENLWGISVFERLYDRMVAFDSATTGAAQLVYKSFLRTYAIDGLQEAATSGGDALVGVSKRVELMRKYQGIEGISLIDSKDKFETHQSTAFTGIADTLIHFAEQLSGSLQVPLVRLLGQSPAGLNSTGESDLRTYYDNILQRQERDLREGVNTVLRVLARSLSIDLPDEFSFNFVPLWQLNEEQKSQISDRDTRTVLEVEAAGLISEKTALQELRQQSRVTGRWTNVTDEMIEQASDVAAPPGEGGEEGAAAGMPGAPEPGQQPAAPGEGAPPGAGQQQDPAVLQHEQLAGLKKMREIRRAVGGDAAYQPPVGEVAGVEVVIECRAGTPRAGEGWRVILPADYGYIRRVPSAEGPEEWLDCFVGPDLRSRDVWVVDAVDPRTGQFDEHKVMLGFSSSRAALDCFRRAYHDGAARRVGGVTHFNADGLAWKDWLARGDMTCPLAAERRVA